MYVDIESACTLIMGVYFVGHFSRLRSGLAFRIRRKSITTGPISERVQKLGSSQVYGYSINILLLYCCDKCCLVRPSLNHDKFRKCFHSFSIKIQLFLSIHFDILSPTFYQLFVLPIIRHKLAFTLSEIARTTKISTVKAKRVVR